MRSELRDESRGLKSEGCVGVYVGEGVSGGVEE